MKFENPVLIEPGNTLNFSRKKAEAINRYFEGKLQPGDVEIIAGPQKIFTVPPPGEKLKVDIVFISPETEDSSEEDLEH